MSGLSEGSGVVFEGHKLEHSGLVLTVNWAGVGV